MASVEELKKQIEREKLKQKLITQKTKVKDDRKALQKELRALRSKNSSYVQTGKKILKGLAQMGSNVVANTEAKDLGIKLGQKIRINNGILTGQTMIIQGFIPGGVRGTVTGHGPATIRHTSYTVV